jgi:hypothetical protein
MEAFTRGLPRVKARLTSRAAKLGEPANSLSPGMVRERSQ